MREISVDFAEPRRIPIGILALALIVSAGALAWQAWSQSQVQSELRSTQAEIATLNVQIDEARGKQKAADDAQSQAAQSPQAMQRAKVRAFPFDEALASVENSKTEGIRLTLLDVSASDGVVRIECDYDKSESIFRYMDQLNAKAGHKWEVTSLRSKPEGSGAGSASIVSKW